MSTQAEFFSRSDFNNLQALNFRLEQLTALPTSDIVVGRLVSVDGTPHVAINATKFARMLRADVAEAILEQWDFQKTGTPPFKVSSTMKVEKLNAEQVDGYDAAQAIVNGNIVVRKSDGQIEVHPVPTAANDAASKDYVDTLAKGIVVKESCRVATTRGLGVIAQNQGQRLVSANASAFGAAYASAHRSINSHGIDGVTDLEVGDRVLVLQEGTTATISGTTGTSDARNGIYRITELGAANSQGQSDGSNFELVRDDDVNEASEVVKGITVFVLEGTKHNHSEWRLISDDVTSFQTSQQQWTETGVGVLTLAGDGLRRVGNTFLVRLGSNSGLRFTGTAGSRGLALDPGRTLPGHTHSAGNITPGTFGTGGNGRYRFPFQIRFGPANPNAARANGDLYVSTATIPGGGVPAGLLVYQLSSSVSHTMARKFSVNHAVSGNATSFTVTHNLGTKDVTVSIYHGATADTAINLIIGLGVSLPTDNTLQVSVDTGVTLKTGVYRVVVTG